MINNFFLDAKLTQHHLSNWSLISETIKKKEDVEKLSALSNKLIAKSFFSEFKKKFIRDQETSLSKKKLIVQSIDLHLQPFIEKLKNQTASKSCFNALEQDLKIILLIAQHFKEKSLNKKSNSLIEITNNLYNLYEKTVSILLYEKMRCEAFENHFNKLVPALENLNWRSLEEIFSSEKNSQNLRNLFFHSLNYFNSNRFIKIVENDPKFLITFLQWPLRSIRKTMKVEKASLIWNLASQIKESEKISIGKKIDLLLETLLHFFMAKLEKEDRTLLIYDLQNHISVSSPRFSNSLKYFLIPELKYNTFLSNQWETLLKWIEKPSEVFLQITSRKIVQSDDISLSLCRTSNNEVHSFLKELIALSEGTFFRFPRYYRSHKIENLSYLIRLFSFAYSSESSSSIKERALTVIDKLSRIDPSFEGLNQICKKYIKNRKLYDDFLKTAIQTASNHSIPIPFRSHRETSSYVSPIRSLFEQVPPISKGENKKSWMLKSLYYAADSELKDGLKSMIENLNRIGQIEGFKVESSPFKDQWPRDLLFQLFNGKFLIPQSHHGHGAHFIVSNFKEARPKDLSNYHDPNPLFNDSSLGRVMGENLDHLKSFEIGEGVFQSQLYFEGGNLLRAQNKGGKKYVLCGAMNLLVSLFLSKERGFFKRILLSERFDKKMQELESSGIFTPSVLQDTIRKIKGSLFLRVELPLIEEIAIAKQIIAQMELIKEILQEEIGEEVIFLESGLGFNQKQLALHLDMTMLSAPNGVIFLESHELCSKLLKSILASGQLTKPEVHQFEDFLKSAHYLNERDGSRLASIRKELVEKGFQVVSVPSRYVSQSCEINYINGIAANGNTGDFIITAGFAGIPGEHYLREAVTLAFKRGGIDTVYFTGRDSTIPSLGRSPIDAASHLNLQSGGSVHCRTFEIYETL